MTRYKNPAIEQLKEQQVRYAPRDVRISQVNNAERLLWDLNPRESIPYPDLCEKITSYRPKFYPDLVITSEEATHDLRCFVEDLSDSANIPVEKAGEAVFTVEELSREYNVSTKTVDRWRDRGLVSRRFLFGGRKRIGFLKSSVDRFVTQHAADIERGSSFRHVSPTEREEMIRRARRMAKFGGCPTELARRLAKKFGRSPETIRYTLKEFDKLQPEAAVFPDSTDPLTNEQRKEIYRLFRTGLSVEELADRFNRTKSSVYRLVSEVRAEMLIEQPIDFIDSPDFADPEADARILSTPPVSLGKPSTGTKPPPGLPPYLASLYAAPLLSREEEVYYFRKMNYLRFKAAGMQKLVDPAHPRAKEMDLIEQCLDKGTEIKNFLIRSNLRLVVSIAKKHMKPNTSFFEMVSDGNMSLIRAIEKFDYTRGFKFSTYASWAIMKNYARSIPAENAQLDRFRTGNEEVFQNFTDGRGDQFQQEQNHVRQHDVIMGILGQLEDREREIIMHRFGLQQGAEPRTLEQVGELLGVTKERIRQLESRALKKLRQIAVETHVDLPE